MYLRLEPGGGQSLLSHNEWQDKRNQPQISQGRFSLDIRKNFFKEGDAKPWNRLPRAEVESHTLRVIETLWNTRFWHLETWLAVNMVMVVLDWWSQRSFPALVVPWLPVQGVAQPLSSALWSWALLGNSMGSILILPAISLIYYQFQAEKLWADTDSPNILSAHNYLALLIEEHYPPSFSYQLNQSFKSCFLHCCFYWLYHYSAWVPLLYISFEKHWQNIICIILGSVNK